MDSVSINVVLLFIVSFSCGDEGYNKDPCEPGDTGLYPHAECQMYYNCSLEHSRYWLGDHVVECSYPYLFNTIAMRCLPFETVKCGKRKELMNGCEYRNNQCNGPHCRPCIYSYSNCTVRNGIIAMESMPNSPYYGVCKDYRFFKKTCPPRMLFDETIKKCKHYLYF